MNALLAGFVFFLGVMSLLFCGIYGNDLEADEDTDLRDIVSHSIDYVDNDPEFLVGARGMENPLCFNTEGKTDQVVRLLQDPETGIIVNARIFYDNLTNKSYIGAVMIAQGSFRILGKQRVVIVNNTKFDWGEVKALNFDGNRVVIRENIVAVTFRQRRITLAIQRHFSTIDDYIDYDALDRENPSRPPPRNTSDNDDSGSATRAESRGDIIPIIGYEEHESLINHFLSSKRRRSLLLQKFFGINQDRAVVRNLMIELDTEGRKKRGTLEKVDMGSKPHKRHVMNQFKAGESRQAKQTLHHLQKNRKQHQEKGETLEPGDHHWDIDHFPQEKKQRKQHHSHRRRHASERHKRDIDDEIIDGDVEKRRNRTVFLGIYIADSRDFSNRTHGLLGQFLFKNITQEKLRFSNGRMKARLFVHGNPSRRTIALLTLRRNMAMNTTRTCWKIRHQGRDVLDGKYSDYLIPALRYSSIKELPPPAPL